MLKALLLPILLFSLQSFADSRTPKWSYINLDLGKASTSEESKNFAGIGYSYYSGSEVYSFEVKSVPTSDEIDLYGVGYGFFFEGEFKKIVSTYFGISSVGKSIGNYVGLEFVIQQEEVKKSNSVGFRLDVINTARHKESMSSLFYRTSFRTK